MPRPKKAQVAVEKAINILDKPDRFRLGEIGSNGIKLFSGVSVGEMKNELNFPRSLQTYQEMSYHASVNSALTLFDNILAKAEWKFDSGSNATDDKRQKAKIIQSMFTDMDNTFGEFVQDALSANTYGFAVVEKVYKQRNGSASKHNDGYIGIKKLALRSQESIQKFVYDDSGNEIIGVKQNLTGLNDAANRFYSRGQTEVVLPRSKFMLFRTGKHRGDPFGKSPLRQAYLTWRFLTTLEELEASGVAKDLVGIPVLTLPPQLLSEDASDNQKQIRAYFENAMRNLHVNAQTHVTLPAVFDQDTKEKMFDLKLLSIDGKKGFDINKIKQYYQNAIYTALQADLLILGQSNTGSFALAQFKNSVAANAAEALARMIKDVINQDLIPQIYELNAWDKTDMVTIDFDGLSSVDLESLGAFIMRVGGQEAIEKDREVLNIIRTAIGADPLPEDVEPRTDLMTRGNSRSGDGAAAGGINGTSTEAASSDLSVANQSNG
jgi:hypothetical protein